MLTLAQELGLYVRELFLCRHLAGGNALFLIQLFKEEEP